MALKPSELILNDDGSVYHLNLQPHHLSKNIIFVGDQDRIEKVTQHFDSIEFSTQKREFKTITGFYKGTKISVISTGIGVDNIDIVLNELDALVNIDFKTRQPKKEFTSLNIIRIGTSGAIQPTIPVDSFLLSSFAIELSGMLWNYKIDSKQDSNIVQSFIQQVDWDTKKALPFIAKADEELVKKFASNQIYQGITLTANGFYGPQGRVLRLPLQDNNINKKIENFEFEGTKITNLEMETGGIYGLSNLLGHKACSLNAIIANRVLGEFSQNPTKTVDNLILYTLQRIHNL